MFRLLFQLLFSSTHPQRDRLPLTTLNLTVFTACVLKDIEDCYLLRRQRLAFLVDHHYVEQHNEKPQKFVLNFHSTI